jgi:hypothetical protein
MPAVHGRGGHDCQTMLAPNMIGIILGAAHVVNGPHFTPLRESAFATFTRRVKVANSNPRVWAPAPRDLHWSMERRVGRNHSSQTAAPARRWPAIPSRAADGAVIAVERVHRPIARRAFLQRREVVRGGVRGRRPHGPPVLPPPAGRSGPSGSMRRGRTARSSPSSGMSGRPPARRRRPARRAEHTSDACPRPWPRSRSSPARGAPSSRRGCSAPGPSIDADRMRRLLAGMVDIPSLAGYPTESSAGPGARPWGYALTPPRSRGRGSTAPAAGSGMRPLQVKVTGSCRARAAPARSSRRSPRCPAG